MLAIASAFAACVHAESPEGSRGGELLAPFKRELQRALKQGLAEGPAEAVAACRLEAPRIARRLASDEVRLGRTSHRLRNPANVAPDWVAPILASYLEPGAQPAPRAVSLPDGRAGYVEPIRLQPLCLTCHGSELAPEVAARIEALYPEDRATGFAVGELRGVFWVEHPASE